MERGGYYVPGQEAVMIGKLHRQRLGAYSRLQEKLYDPWEQGYRFRDGLWHLQHPEEASP